MLPLNMNGNKLILSKALKITGYILLFGFLMVAFSCEEYSAMNMKLTQIDSIADVAPRTALAMLDSIELDNSGASEA